jgi:hypothetical protein
LMNFKSSPDGLTGGTQETSTTGRITRSQVEGKADGTTASSRPADCRRLIGDFSSSMVWNLLVEKPRGFDFEALADRIALAGAPRACPRRPDNIRP